MKTKNISESKLINSIDKKINATLLMLESHEFQATFFIDITLVEALKKSIKNISFAGHEIAFYNSNSDLQTIEKAKQNLEDFLQKPIRGLRQKFHQIPHSEIKKLDFNYVSNIEESRINFLWRKLTANTEIHIENDLTIIPESQSPYSQLPFNDYVLQVTPMKYYENMLLESLKNNEYVMIYANIWQLYESEELPIELPFYKKINIGRKFKDRLEELFQFINENEMAVYRIKDYLF